MIARLKASRSAGAGVNASRSADARADASRSADARLDASRSADARADASRSAGAGANASRSADARADASRSGGAGVNASRSVDPRLDASRSGGTIDGARRLQPSVLYLAAAALVAAALALPLWGFAMSAPQYPDETLHLRVARHGIAGDVHEVSTLQQYIGVAFPRELPELRLATTAMLALTALLLTAAFAGAGRLARVYRALCAAALLLFLAASAVAVQARLYRVGHERDRSAPIRAVRDFTPPLVGAIKVGNFTVWSFPHVGAVLLLAAAGLSVAGARKVTQ